MMSKNPRDQIGESLTGDVLEIGPGSNPFPTAPGARVRYADRSVAGGRDANWPELIGHPVGINADFDINLDTDYLSPIADESVDAVVASHVIEHVANPLKAINEFERVLRPNGRLVLIIPDRGSTFDSVRAATPFQHVLQEFKAGVTEVDDAHIIDFCSAIYNQPSIHPPSVREWHNPAGLNADLIALHRRRSIHVHCWSPEEFASLIVGALSAGLFSWKLLQFYTVDDSPGSGEFGIVLQRVSSHVCGNVLSKQFVQDWSTAILSEEHRDMRRLIHFQRALRRDLDDKEELQDVISLPSSILIGKLQSTRRDLLQMTKVNEISVANRENRIADLEQVINGMKLSASWRVTHPIRIAKKVIRRLIYANRR